METIPANSEFFHLLYQASIATHIRLPVPTTLIMGFGFKKPTLIKHAIRRNSFDSIRMDEIEYTLVSNFNEETNTPCAIVKTEIDQILCFSIQEIMTC